MERRNYPRIKIDNLLIDIYDGKRFFRGKATDISRTGLCMEELPKHLKAETRKLTVVVSGERDHFRLVVTPRWYVNGSQVNSIGAEILSFSLRWENLVSRLEPLSDDLDFSEMLH